MNFEKVKNIKLKNKKHLRNIYLTFDLDWCSDEILSYTLDILEKYDLKATFFITHKTKLLNRMRENPKFELGIHPNFNFLLKGDFRYGKNIDEVIKFYKKIVPEALSARSHCLTQSSLILESYEKFGIIFECNNLIPFSSKVELVPYPHWTKKLIRIPFFWEDDVHCMYKWSFNVDKFKDYRGIKVFNFHPLHIFLNTKNISFYEKNKRNLINNDKIYKYKHKGKGTESFLINLIKIK